MKEEVEGIKGQRISWLGHQERMEEDRMPIKIFIQELEVTRRRGRPRKRWKEKVEWIKGQRISWLVHLERMEEDRMPIKIFTQELEGTRRRGRPRKRWKEEVESDLQVLGVRRWRQLVADRKKMEGHCSTGQSPQWAVVPMEEEEEGESFRHQLLSSPSLLSIHVDQVSADVSINNIFHQEENG